MFENPFTPTFGGKPDFFFGRHALLERFDEALANRGSADRALFITGNRGCGKTALLEQFSMRAERHGWLSVDINSENALEVLTRSLVRHQAATREVAPELEVSILGSGGRVGGVSSSKTVAFDKKDIELILLEACKEHPEGIMLTIDEIQKIDLDDLSLICGAFQMASRKGFDVIMAVAGLPYSHDAVIQHEGCTYMRRAPHESLSVFTHDEARDAFVEAFGHVKGLGLGEAALERLVAASYGHPFFIQLAGYALVKHANSVTKAKTYRLTEDDVESVLPEVIRDYEARSLVPILSALTKSERAYLDAMAANAGADGKVMSTGITQELGKSTKQLSMTRKKLLDQGIIVAPAHGVVMFNIPYLRPYLAMRTNGESDSSLAEEWQF